MPRPLHALLSLALAAALMPGCAQDEPPVDPAAALVGTWEITGEAGTLNRNGQLYVFAENGSLQITRPRPLGPASTINAAYDFIDDSTLQIRSQFDAENLIPVVRGDTLLLRPLGTGEPMLLVRLVDAPPVPPAPPPPPPDSVYSPPLDAPLDELPPAQPPAQPPAP
ncbi:MAG: hypothetical protein ABJF88_18895 [Rhodothermales bacterium]